MSQAPVQSAKPAKKPIIPPEESFWQRYSAHHEAPLSGVSALALHLLAIPLLLLVGWLVIKLGVGEDSRPILSEPVLMEGGGGGSRIGPEGEGSDKDQPQKGGAIGDPNKGKPSQPESDQRKPLTPAQVKEIRSEFPDDPLVKIWVNEPTPNFQGWAWRVPETREALRQGVNPGKGKGGTGSGGGMGSGTGTGTGSGTGPAKGTLTQNERRVLRWHLTFNTNNGQDYARQLQGLGAIVALPTKDPKRFDVIENLSERPVKTENRGVADIDRIFWVDDVPRSVAALTRDGLGLKESPPYFVAFFPRSLEDRLLKIELEYQEKKTGKRNEDVIHETQFNVVKTGDKYDVTVASQRYIK